MNLPKISIVTPSFNQEEYIEDTIRSVVLQDYPNLEYIVIDGGSSDNSARIIEKYESKISYWVSEPDGGHGAGLNKGFEKSNGEIMGWINSDDMLTPWSLSTVAEIFEKFPHVNWIQGFNSFWNKHGQMVGAKPNPKNIYDYLIGNYAWIQQESVFWRRSLWDKAGGNISEEMKFMVDGELWSRFFLHDHLYTVNCIWGGWRFDGKNRSSNNYLECRREMEICIRKMTDHCSLNTLETAKKLRLCQKLSESFPFRKTIGTSNAQKVLGKTIAKELFQTTGYRSIAWDASQSQWTCCTLARSI